MSAARFKKIFEPTNIGRMQLKNRIVMPPMGTNYAEAGGAVNIEYADGNTRGEQLQRGRVCRVAARGGI